MKGYRRLVDEISSAGCIASALEACGWPKPGNVHRTADYPDTKFEHFIVGSIALKSSLRGASERGFKIGRLKDDLGKAGIGRFIKYGVEDVSCWHKGGNTHLGTIMLLIPLASAAGFVSGSGEKIVPNTLRLSVGRLLERSTVDDAVNLYRAVRRIAPAWIGRLHSEFSPPDVKDPRAESKLRSENITFFKVMEYSSKWDRIASELKDSMKISFEIGYPTFIKIYEATKQVNTATVQTFLTILSKYPDTFIIRKIASHYNEGLEKGFKIGLRKAEEVSRMAEEALSKGGLMSQDGTKALFEMDLKLRRSEGMLNPGTSADITASSIMIALLTDFRP